MAENMPTNFNYFLLFVREKIRDGVKQVDIARSKEVNKSAAFINKLYKGDPKSCPLETQKSISAYFEIPYEQMIEGGRHIYERLNPPVNNNNLNGGDDDHFPERKIVDTKDLINLANQVVSGIKSNAESLRVAEKKAKETEILLEKINLFNLIFSNLDEGVTFFDHNKEFVYSSNRWSFLEDVDLTTKPSIEILLLTLRKKIVNFNEVVDSLFHASKGRKETRIDVDFINGAVFVFRILPIFDKGVFMGFLLVNTLKTPPQATKD